MFNGQQAELVMEADLTGVPLTRQVEMGELVEELIDSQAFSDLVEVVKLHRDGLVAMLTYRSPSENAASYADVIGHIRGLGELEPIARGIVENGKNAAAELRSEEEGNS